ncbi:MAG: AAA family ATPase [Candidatus Methanomethylophilus sp.]|nr:AAA family ATPase [Methanomethylophilus sp.]
MQTQFKSSRYPSDLVEKFSLQTDAARKYVPEEQSTIVLNFSEYWYGQGAEPKQSKRFSPFKNSLTEQFKLLSYDITKSRELITFIYNCLYRARKKTVRPMYICHPSFYKTHPDEDSELPLELENAAIRIPLNANDLVLMGDIVSKAETKFTRVEFVVKGISVLNKSTHYGEKKIDAAIISRVVNSSSNSLDRNWMEGFYTTKGELADGKPKNIYMKSVITPALIEELNELYIVKDPGAVISMLNEWSDFLTTERQEADESEIRGFAVERPEFFMAVPLPPGSVTDRQPIVETPEAVWIDSTGSDAKARLLVRITHPIEHQLYENDPKYVEKFNKLTAMGIKIIDPARALSENNMAMDRKERELAHRMSRVGNERLQPARPTGLLPEEVVRPAKERRNEALAQLDSELKQQADKEIDRMSSEYLATEAVVTDIEAYLDSIADTLAEEAEEERKNRADDESDGGRNWKEAYESISPEECFDAVKERFRNQRRAELVNERRGAFRMEAEKTLGPVRKQRRTEIEAKFGKEMEELYKGADKSTLTVFFEIPLSSGAYLLEEYYQRQKFFEKGSQFKIVADQTGTQTNITRQMDALESFKNGEVANPYLASYLFSTSDTRLGDVTPIGHFFGKNFNDLQRRAVEEAVNSDGLYLIQGPPGTGKTQVISEITTQEVLRGRKVLITSQNNKAIDNAFDRLLKNPLIRPVRLMSEGRSSDYELESIVSNFYRNTANSLENQIGLYSDPKKKYSVETRFDRTKDLYKEYCDAKDDADDELMDIEDDRLDLATLSQKLESNRRAADGRRSKLFLLRKSLESIDQYELTTYNEHSKEIKDLFRDSVVLTTKSRRRDGESELEGKLFGRYGYCAAIMSLSEDDFFRQINLIEENRPYTDLYIRLCRAKEEADKTAIQGEIDSLVESTNLQIEDFVLLHRFGADLPSSLPEIRDRLSRIREKVRRKIEARIDRYSSEDPNTESDEELLKKIAEVKDEISEIEQEKKYKEYLRASEALAHEIQSLFNDLGISEKFTTLDEAYEILERRVATIYSLDDKDVELSRRTYEDIIRYLREEGIDKNDRDRLMKELRNFVNVVGITCTAEGRTMVDTEGDEDNVYLDVTTMGIDVVIIDEVSKVPFPELLRPILSGKSIIMVGDHKQLPPIYNVKYDKNTVSPDDPIVEREERFKKMYTEPLFKTLFESAPDQSKIMLKQQYRMASQIMEAINRFYGDSLEMGCRDEDKAHRIVIPGKERNLIDGNNSVVFIDCRGSESMQQGSTSFENQLEADVVTRMVNLLEEHCTCDSSGTDIANASESDKMSLGIITPYAAQARLIRKQTDQIYERLRKRGIPSKFRSFGEEKFAVKSVDDFQGDERDIIILSLVRTGKSTFISDFRRINVAMSRARRLLVLVGNAESLEKEEIDLDGQGEPRPVYKEIIDRVKENGGYLSSDDIMEVNE